MKAVDLRELKRKEAEERNAKWAALPFEEQLAMLDKAFGKGKGAVKQRAKIAKQIALRDAQPVKKTEKKSKRRQDARKAKA